MQIEAVAVRLRRRTAMQAADLGIRLCQDTARPVWTCYLLAVAPVASLGWMVARYSPSASILILWLAKPWLDRTVLYVLSRRVFAVPTTTADLWRDRRSVWGGQLLATLVIQRLSSRRSFTQPIYQLEGLHGRHRLRRLAVLRGRALGAARSVTAAFSVAESALLLALLSAAYWLTPLGMITAPADLWRGEAAEPFREFLAAAYFAVVLFLEPFYVASGFALYLNRRVQLEAWDIEQEFRRAFHG